MSYLIGAESDLLFLALLIILLCMIKMQHCIYNTFIESYSLSRIK